MRTLLFLMALAAPSSSFADPRTQRLLARLAEEAAAFERVAPNLISEETLRQNALTASKTRVKPGTEGSGPPPATAWKQREIRSEYVFAAVGKPAGIRELRKVIAVDGKSVSSSEHAMDDLLRTIQVNDERSRKKLLEDFEKHGLIGTVTDFGQVVLLFAQPSQAAYTFNFAGERLMGAERCHVYAFHQQDGPGAMTVWDSTGMQQPRISGEIWMTREAYKPVRIKLNAVRKEGTVVVREEADVEYAASPHGVVVPASVSHKQYRDGNPTAENRSTYGEFRKFGAASAVLKYATDADVKR